MAATQHNTTQHNAASDNIKGYNFTANALGYVMLSGKYRVINFRASPLNLRERLEITTGFINKTLIINVKILIQKHFNIHFGKA
jgi:hypothetical protein